MKKNVLWLAITLVVGMAYAQKPQFTIVNSNAQEMILKVNFYDYQTSVISMAGQTAYRLHMDGAYPILSNGGPELLEAAVSIIIPENSQPTVEVMQSSYSTIENFTLVPSKGRLLRDVDPSTVPYVKNMQYLMDKNLCEDSVHVGSPYQLRDYHGVALQFYPFAYNPVQRTLRVCSEMTVRIKYHQTGTIHNVTKVASVFDNIYQEHFLNYAQTKSNPVEEFGGILILAPENFCAAMQPYADWKIKNGYPTTIVPLSAVGNNSNTIKSYIQSYYNTHNIAYVIIVGDNQQFPTPTVGGNVSDNYYTEVAGNDVYPDIILGKISAETVEQVSTQVNKFIQYEKNPPMSAHFSKFLGIASSEGPGDNNEYDYQHIRNIDNLLQTYTYDGGYELFDGNQGGLDASGDPTAAQVATAVNAGVGIINYTGHGAETYWVSSNFSNSHVNNLTNDNLLPFIISVACVNGAYSGRTCFAEAWLRATHNGQPSGAVSTLMSTINQPWNSPMCAQDHMNQILTGTSSYISQKHTFGGIIINGIIKMLDNYNDSEVARTWIIFGDPSLMVRTAMPQTLTVNYDEMQPIGVSSIAFTCPVEGARITLTNHNEIISSGIVANGSLSLDIPSSISPDDTLFMVANAPNYIPAEGTVQFIVQDGPYVVCNNLSFVDHGNGNGEADYGETVDINAVFNNMGNQTANNISASITTEDPYINIINSTDTINQLDPNTNTTRSNAFSFSVANNVPAFHNATIQMTITFDNETKTKSFVIPLHAPQLSISDNIQIMDDNYGNGNHRFDLNETTILGLDVQNFGNGEAQSGMVYLNSVDGKIHLFRYPQAVSPLGVQNTQIAYFKARAESSITIPTIAELRAIYRSGEYMAEKTIYVKIGAQTEDWESGDFTSYNWNQGSNNKWIVTTQTPYEGDYAVRSANIGNSASSTLSINWTNSQPDSISFYYLVSSESDYDFLTFRIDNSEKGKWSGEIGWSRAAFYVPAGQHTFTWVYSKDNYMTAGRDLAMIDYVELPANSVATGIEDLTQTSSSISVIPNPTTDIVRVIVDENTNLDHLHYQLYDMSGRLLQSDNLHDNMSSISLGRYARGMYYIVISDAHEILFNTKIIKQ